MDVTKETFTDPHYIASNKNGWTVEMLGSYGIDDDFATHTGTLGMVMTNFTIECEGIKKARVQDNRGRWLPYKTGFDKVNGLSGKFDKPIKGIEIVGAGFKVAAHLFNGEWIQPKDTSDVEGEVLITVPTAIDAIWVSKK